MLKKFLALSSCLVLLLCAGCQKKDASSSEIDTSSEPVTQSVTEPVKEIDNLNPLTGLNDLDGDKENARPIAVMINNIKTAQRVQTGLNKADIVYETEVEGGITRLMAVFKDITKVNRLGTIRSARYPYVDLAMGHNAIYVHCGQDKLYCAPHLNDIDDVSVDTGNGAKRIQNGLASEHTLYAYGEDLLSYVSKKISKTTQTNNASWQNFADTDETVTLNGGVCTNVSVPFSTTYITGFSYNAATGLYTRLSGGNVLKDYVTGESVEVKNVFVLMTTITDYPDGYHRKVALQSGNGYYITNGTYTPINWSKGSSSNPIKITYASGAEIKVSAGKSWVCIADKTTSNPTIK